MYGGECISGQWVLLSFNIPLVVISSSSHSQCVTHFTCGITSSKDEGQSLIGSSKMHLNKLVSLNKCSALAIPNYKQQLVCCYSIPYLTVVSSHSVIRNENEASPKKIVYIVFFVNTNYCSVQTIPIFFLVSSPKLMEFCGSFVICMWVQSDACNDQHAYDLCTQIKSTEKNERLKRIKKLLLKKKKRLDAHFHAS